MLVYVMRLTKGAVLAMKEGLLCETRYIGEYYKTCL